ncbi:hypothetical protein BpHYR1_022962 [Brachionus plicatilis]|uniref:Uncharacterized protein n=1 Tax=Brachionus plicatilis TaxID=10195 RepID=A0A3M7RAC9_BRAPC|nr:hypothetical protein BpHYR1_022962 [Brachionus plicatilis]
MNILNEFYKPELFEIISKKFYLIPLWTGILPHSFFSTQSSLIKNSENIRLVFTSKKNLLQNRRVKASEHGSLIYNRHYYNSDSDEESHGDKEDKKIYDKQIEEKWDDDMNLTIIDSFQSLDFDILFNETILNERGHFIDLLDYFKSNYSDQKKDENYMQLIEANDLFNLVSKIPYSSKVDMCENREKPITIGFLNHHFVPLLTPKFDKVKEILLFIASQKHLP